MTDYARLLAEYSGADDNLAQQRAADSARPPDLVVRCAKDVTTKPIHWRWRRRLPCGRYIELIGFPGIGKTAVVMDMIARLTDDGQWPDGTQGEPCDVVIVAAEDEADDVLVPRLLAAGANLARVHFVDGIRRGTRAQAEEVDLSQLIDFALVVKLCAKVGAGLVYIDALDDVLGAKHDGKGYTETRRALAPVRRLARETGATVLGLRHPTKRVAVGPALNNGNGSVAYGAVARGSLLVTVDPDDPERRLLLATKSNISRLADTLAFRLECQADEDVPPKIVWDAKADPRTADDVLADLRTREQSNPNDAEAEQSKVEQAEALVKEWHTGPNGGLVWVTVTELERLARQRDVAPKTLRAATSRLELRYHRDGFGPGSRMLSALPGTDPYSPISCDMGEYGSKKPAATAEPVGGQPTSAPPHTSPSHTRPSWKTDRGASMPDELELAYRELVAKREADGGDHDPEPSGGPPNSPEAIALANWRARQVEARLEREALQTR